MDRIASLTNAAKDSKRLSIGVDTEDSVEDYDEEMDEDEGGWSDDDADDDAAGDGSGGDGQRQLAADGTPLRGGSGSAKRRKSARPGSTRASPLASGSRVAHTEDEAVQLLLTASGQATIELDPSIDKEAVRRRVDEERERLRREAEGLAASELASTAGASSDSGASAASSVAAGAVNYQETDLFKKLQAMRASAETASSIDSSGGAGGGASVVSPRSTIDKPTSALPALKITAEVDPAAAPVRRKESTVVSPRDKKDKKKKDKADKKEKDKADKERDKADKAAKSPREKKGVLASLLGK